MIRRGRGRAGFTFIELAVAMPIILVAASLLFSTIVATSQQRRINSDNAQAVEALRGVLESMRNENFDQVFALYNAEPFDDPKGPGTALGNRFAIRGLTPLPEAADGMIAEIFLPIADVSAGGPLPLWQIREDVVDERLGMPRDLNGDNVVDDKDHSGDYKILPVLLDARWQAPLGARRFRMFTLLTEYRT